ncbi:N-6 DNA methylase [Glycomyces scopariae]
MTTRDAGPGETITLTDLARLAAVGRNAVSNWRRREPDFPAPVDDSPRRPRFSLSALESWAEAHGRELHVTGADRLWFRLSSTHPTAEAALEEVAAAFDKDTARSSGSGTGAEGPTTTPANTEDDRGKGRSASPAHPDLVAEVQALATQTPASDLFEFFIERAREAAGTGVPPGIAPLAGIAAAVSGDRADLRVFDPACDEGDLLAAVTAKAGPFAALGGQDLSAARAKIAERRIRLLDDRMRSEPTKDESSAATTEPPQEANGPKPPPRTTDPEERPTTPSQSTSLAEVTVHVGDSLLTPLPANRYDLVVCDPPFNLKDWGYDQLPDGADPRLAYGTPPRTEPELAWALHCAALLDAGGYAVVRMPAQVAHRRSGRRIRSELLRWGALRAVVDHPEAKAHIWVLAPRGETTQLLVSNGRDFADAWAAFTAAPDAPLATADSATVPLMRLWDEDVDVSPAVYLTSTSGGAEDISDAAAALSARLNEIAGTTLPNFRTGPERSAPETSLGDLERDGHLVVAPGGGEADEVRCVIVDPIGEPPVRIGVRRDAAESQWAITCEPTVDLGWIAAALSARLAAASKRTATGAKRRILSVKIPRLTLDDQQRRGAAFARLEELRTALTAAGRQAEALAAEAAAGLVSGAVTAED